MTNKGISSIQDYAVWGLAGTIMWGSVIFLFFVVTQVAVMAMYIGVVYGDIPSSEVETLFSELGENGLVISLATIASLVVCGLLLAGVIKLKSNSSFQHYLALKAVGRGAMMKWLGVVLCLVIVSDLLTLFLDKPIVPEFPVLRFSIVRCGRKTLPVSINDHRPERFPLHPARRFLRFATIPAKTVSTMLFR